MDAVMTIDERYLESKMRDPREIIEGTTGSRAGVDPSSRNVPWRATHAVQISEEAQPPIPEPIPRIHPLGSFVSVREKEQPKPTYHSVRKACQFYELKSSGKYSSKTLAGRYIFQLSREVQRQISFLEEADKKKDRRITFLENLVKEWEEVFGRPSDEDIKTFTAGNGPQTLLTPEALANELRRSRVQIADLEREVEAMRKKKEDAAARAQAAIDQHFEQSRKQYREEAERLKDQRDAEVARANDERDRAIKKMQEKTDKTIATMQESQDKVIADAMADIDRRIKEETRAGLADANSEKARVVLETEKRQRELQMERIRQLADIQRREKLIAGQLKAMRDRHQADMAALRARHNSEMKKAMAQVNTQEKATSTKTVHMQQENVWLRQRVADLQEIVVAFQTGVGSVANLL